MKNDPRTHRAIVSFGFDSLHRHKLHAMKLLLLLFALSVRALANDTALHDGRFGPEPLDAGDGRESPVRMEREHLQVDFGRQFTVMHATFTFRNSASSGVVEHLVGFPDIGAACDEMKRRDPAHASVISERVNTAPLLDLRTLIDGQEQKASLRLGEVKPGGDKDGNTVWSFDKASGIRAWHVVSVRFPAGKDVTIERHYRVQNGMSALGVAFFHYTTATGGVWHGRIGRMQVDAKLSDGLKVGEIVWPDTKVGRGKALDAVDAIYATQPARSEWQVIDDTHLRLIWTDFEPRTEKHRRGFSLSRPFHGW